VRFEMIDVDALLTDDHPARLVWAFVEQMNLDAFYAAVGSRQGEAGRPAADPAVLLALWLFATIEGVGSGRALERLVERDCAYRWLAGGVEVNYHGLCDFRTGHGELLDRLLTESVTALVAEGLVNLDEVLTDGTKIAASAGKGSFAGEDKLMRTERLAAERIARLRAEIEADPGAASRRRKAGRERAARELAERTQKARQALEKLRREKDKRKASHGKEEASKGEPRVSLSDPEARYMVFADGAVRPGYNIQIAAVSNGVVVAVEASDRRNDSGLALPMVEEIETRYGRRPLRLLADSKFATAGDIESLAANPRAQVLVYAPPPAERLNVKPDTLRRRLAARAKEPAAIKDWRARMETPEGLAVYGRRRRIELVNAHFKNRGFARLTLRGIVKAKIIAVMQALAHNLTLAHHLRTKPA
jgi:transposase